MIDWARPMEINSQINQQKRKGEKTGIWLVIIIPSYRNKKSHDIVLRSVLFRTATELAITIFDSKRETMQHRTGKVHYDSSIRPQW
jgi:hypothetical protein